MRQVERQDCISISAPSNCDHLALSNIGLRRPTKVKNVSCGAAPAVETEIRILRPQFLILCARNYKVYV